MPCARRAAGCSAIESQNDRSAALACTTDPFASAPAMIAALIAPALVPLSCAMATPRLLSNASRTPQVYAPNDPPPCSAKLIGLRVPADRRWRRTRVAFMALLQRDQTECHGLVYGLSAATHRQL